jgi:glycosyltransferase involved in cell wall biosynthesis
MNVSVIIPNFNYEQYIEQAINSVLNSNFDENEMEIIVVDDASTDHSVYVIDKLMNESKVPIRLLINEINMGLTISRNRGIAHSRGEFLFFLDSDNFIHENCIKTLFDILRADQDAIACYSPIQDFLDGTFENQNLRSNQPFDYTLLLQGPYIDAMAMFRKKSLIEIGMYNHKMPPYGWEDYELWMRIGKLDKKVLFVPSAPLSYYRIHNLNMSTNFSPDQYNHLVYFLKQYYPISLELKKSTTLEGLIPQI